MLLAKDTSTIPEPIDLPPAGTSGALASCTGGGITRMNIGEATEQAGERAHAIRRFEDTRRVRKISRITD